MLNNMDQAQEVFSCISNMLNGYNSGITEAEFYGQNILDVSDVSEEDMKAANSEVIKYCEENGCYAALPPFEEGSFIDTDQRRYIHWKVLEVKDDYYRMSLDHYPIMGLIEPDDSLPAPERDCWYLSDRITVKVKLLTDEEHRNVMAMHPDYIRYADALCGGDPAKKADMLAKLSQQLKSVSYVGGIIEDHIELLTHDYIKISKKGKYSTPDGHIINGALVRQAVDASLKYSVPSGIQSALFVSSGPMIEMFTYVNYMLSQKATSGSSTFRHIDSIYCPKPDGEEVRKERHFGKIKFVSEKKPKGVNAENIQRVYTTMAWQRRSHLRHLASGKVVPVKSAVCKRHNVEDATAPQVIYKA